MNIGNRIKHARERLVPEVTQQHVANALGISDKAVSGWELGSSKPARDRMPELARVLKVPLAWLSEGSGEPPAPDDLVVLIEALTEDDRDMLRIMAETMLKRHGRAA